MEGQLDLEAVEARHELIQEQLELVDGWVEHLPVTDFADRKTVMTNIVDFLQRYVLVHAAWEEEHLFPKMGERAAVFTDEHRFIARWVKELDALAHAPGIIDAVRFRRAAYKLLGLLEAHMHAEESAIRALNHEAGQDLVGGVPAEIT